MENPWDNIVVENKPLLTFVQDENTLDEVYVKLDEDDNIDDSEMPENDWFSNQNKEEEKKAQNIYFDELPIYGSKEIEISAGLMKQFFSLDYQGKDVEKNICPKKLYVESILRSYNITSSAMLAGLFFECMCYGKTAQGAGIFDLPRGKITKKMVAEWNKAKVPMHLRKGPKLIDQQKIELQVELFKKKCDYYSVHISDVNVQQQVKLKSSNGVTVRGTFDIFPTSMIYEDNGYCRNVLANIDLKLTKSIEKGFGDFDWKKALEPSFDKTQAYLYSFLMRHINYKTNPHLEEVVSAPMKKMLAAGSAIFSYWVFAYSGDYDKLHKQFLNIPIDYDENTERYIIDKIKGTISVIDKYAEQGWPCIPSFDICNNCPMSHINHGKCIEAPIQKGL